MAPVSKKNVKKTSGSNPKTKLNSLKQKKKNAFLPKSKPKETESPLEIKVNPKQIKTTAKIPTKRDEASSNWKNLYTAIKPKEETKKYALFLKQKKEVALGSKSKVSKDADEPEVWFDNVDPILLDTLTDVSSSETQLVIDGGAEGLTKALALDCEMVGIGSDGKESALARISIVNQFGKCVYDKYVIPGEAVTDYRTEFSGIRPHNLKNAIDLGTVCHEVSAMLRGRTLVGHGLRNDLQVLLMKHPKGNTRDTSKYKHFRALVDGATPSLKKLAHQFLGIQIQSGEHSSIQDAQAAMRLYTMFRQKWETDLSTRRKERRGKLTQGKQTKLDAKNAKEMAESDDEGN